MMMLFLKTAIHLTVAVQEKNLESVCGAYQISKEEYDSSPSSTGATNEKLIHDFGVLPDIEEDVRFRKDL